MPCYHPKVAFRAKHKNENGKRPLTFMPQDAAIADIQVMKRVKNPDAFRDVKPLMIPCGDCLGCRLEQARQWAVRCMHEASLHEENCFVTLTYNDENLPADGCVSKREFQLFMKRLRKKFSKEVIRFYGCGEYGKKFNRPHYHICIFGFDFPDKEILRSANYFEKNGKIKKTGGFDLYRSAALEEVWTKGFSSIGEVTFESAGYVARYIGKKAVKEERDKHYGNKVPEFALMSRGGVRYLSDGTRVQTFGIGHDWFEKYHGDIYPKDFFTLGGVKYRPARYYDNLLGKVNPELLAELKIQREKEQEENDHGLIWLSDREKFKKCQTKNLHRRFENEN